MKTLQKTLLVLFVLTLSACSVHWEIGYHRKTERDDRTVSPVRYAKQAKY